MGNTKFAVNLCKFFIKDGRIVSVLIKMYPEGRPRTSDVNSLCGISGLSFDSPYPFPFFLFCLVLLLFLACHFSANGPFSRPFFFFFFSSDNSQNIILR